MVTEGGLAKEIIMISKLRSAPTKHAPNKVGVGKVGENCLIEGDVMGSS